MSGPTPQEVLAAVDGGALTLLDRPEWLTEGAVQDLHLANAGCVNAAIRLAPVLADGWAWRIGYDNLAEMVWSEDPAIIVRVISLTPAHALLQACLRVHILGPKATASASGGGVSGPVVETAEGDHKIVD